MIFNNAELLSYNHESNFFGGDVIRYRTNKNVEVQGYLLNLTNTSGVSGILSGIAALESSAIDEEFIINGISFGTGFITNISLDDSNDVRTKKYSVSLQIKDSGSIANLPTNDSYSGINYTDYRYLPSLTEKLDLNRNFDKDIYTHSINATVYSDGDIADSMDMAKSIARNLFESNAFYSYVGNYYGISGKKSTYQESYDKIKGECAFTQTLELFANDSGNYSINKEYSYKREQNGVVTVSEQGQIKASVEPYINILTDAYKLESLNSLTNCQQVFNAYKESDVYDLNLIEVTKGTSLSRYEKMMTYEHTFSNDLSINDGYFWEYNNDSSINEKGEIVTQEQGTVIGRGHRVDVKYANALAGWDIVDNAINTRTLAAYDRYRTFISLPYSSNYTPIKKQESYLKHIGQISYDWSYSNDSSLVVGDPNIIKSQITVSEQDKIPLYNKFNVFNVGEIEQSTKNYIVSQKSVGIELKGKRNTSVDTYLTYAKSLILADYKGDFLTEANYSISPFSNSFSMNVAWGKIYEPV